MINLLFGRETLYYSFKIRNAHFQTISMQARSLTVLVIRKCGVANA